MFNLNVGRVEPWRYERVPAEDYTQEQLAQLQLVRGQSLDEDIRTKMM